MTDIPPQIESWFNANKRDLPWRENKSAYKTWLSEIILQQTRVAQGLPYFQKFLKNYPSIKDFAMAQEDELLNLWQGLGYYSRCRNMHKAAKQIMEEFDGIFPSNSKELKKLKGVGDYTAAAIASINFNEKIGVVDGNVYRVLSRVFNIDIPIDSSQGKKHFQGLANTLIQDSDSPGNYNQGLMEIGAIICKPRNPNCEDCPLLNNCESARTNLWENLPVKSRKIKVKVRYFDFIVAENGNELILEKRTQKDIWQNLYQFPLIESKNKNLEDSTILKKYPKAKILGFEDKKHKLTHQDIRARIWHLKIDNLDKILESEQFISAIKNTTTYGFPILLDNYLNKVFER